MLLPMEHTFRHMFKAARLGRKIVGRLDFKQAEFAGEKHLEIRVDCLSFDTMTKSCHKIALDTTTPLKVKF